MRSFDEEARYAYEGELVGKLSHDLRSVDNLTAFLMTYAKRYADGLDPQQIDLRSLVNQADQQDLLEMCWNAGRYRGYVDSAAFNHQKIVDWEEERRNLSLKAEEAKRVPDMERDLHEAASYLAQQRNQIQDLETEIREKVAELERNREQLRTLLGNSWRYRATERVVAAARALQEKWHYR